MINQWLSWINCAIGATILCLLTAASLLWITRPSEISQGDLQLKQSRLPKSAFELAPEAYSNLNESLLALQSAPPTLQLPDLKQQLIYYGRNGRPDAQSQHTSLHFSMNGNKDGHKGVVSIPPGEPLYLQKAGSGRYAFSPNNQKTSLWITGIADNNEVIVSAAMENDKGEIITEPKSNAEFRLPEKEFIRYAGATWEIGTFRVDGTLFARMHARWFGPDKFLENHGGDEYAHVNGKQRIDFGEAENVYSVFVTTGDCLIWDPEALCWKEIQPGENSLKYPLLVVKKIEERLMSFELWDVEGKGKVALNILKSTEPLMTANAQNLQQTFKFVGARTRTQCVFEVNNERMVLSPTDWLLLTPKGWKKLASEEEIDDYVKRKATGPLFVFDGIERRDEKQILVGILYNGSRCDSQPIEMALTPGGTGNKPVAANDPKETKESKDTKEMIESLKEKIQNQIRPGAQSEPPKVPIMAPAVPPAPPTPRTFNR